MNRFRRSLLLGGVLEGLACSAWPTPAPAPPVLTVRAPGGINRSFDMAALAQLPQRDIITATPWYDRPRKFTGPLLRDVLAAAGAKGSMVKAIALNDYAVDIPLSDAMAYDMVVARLLDGQPMPRREKGPLFIIYPFDERTELRKQVYFTRCAWQLRDIVVR